MYIYKICFFCEEGDQIIQNKKKYARECVEVKKWFVGLGRNVNEKIQKVLNDDSEEEKGKILERILMEGKKEEKKRKKE